MHTTYHVSKSNIGRMNLNQKYVKNTQTAFVSPSKYTDKKEKQKKKAISRDDFNVCQLNFLLYCSISLLK